MRLLLALSFFLFSLNIFAATYRFNCPFPTFGDDSNKDITLMRARLNGYVEIDGTSQIVSGVIEEMRLIQRGNEQVTHDFSNVRFSEAHLIHDETLAADAVKIKEEKIVNASDLKKVLILLNPNNTNYYNSYVFLKSGHRFFTSCQLTED